MKRIIHKICLAIALTSLLTACKKDILDQAPELDLNEEATFSDIDLTHRFLVNTYASTFSRSASFLDLNWSALAAACDEADNSYQWTDAELFQKGTWNQVTNPDGNWNGAYANIRKCNILLSKLDNVPDKYAGTPQASDLTPRRMKGETFFLRAFNYFELLKRYGGVPLVSGVLPPTDEIKSIRRGTIDETVAFIIKDCDSVIANNEIPLKWSVANNEGNIGRATKTVAKALKARTLLYFASPLFNMNNVATRWSAAAAVLREIIIDGQYSLYSAANPNYQNNYADLFLTGNNSEIIFSNATVHAINGSDSYMYPVNLGGGWGGVSPTQNFVDKYEMKTSGKPISDPTSGYNPQAPYTDRDPRFYASFNYDGATFRSTTLQMFYYPDPSNPSNLKTATHITHSGDDASKTGYYLRKFLNYNNASGRRYYFPIFRLGEVYLSLAEAVNEADGPVTEVYNAVNIIRARAGMPNLPAGLTQTEMRDRIRNERAVELAFEKHRFWDVRRWKTAETVLNSPVTRIQVVRPTSAGGTPAYNYLQLENRTFVAPKMYLYPIPQTEIDKNPANLQQNPGW